MFSHPPITTALSAAEPSSLLLFATVMASAPGPNTTPAATLAAHHGLRHALRLVLALVLLAAAVGMARP